MNSTIHIYGDNNLKEFFNQLFKDYNVVFKNIKELKKIESNSNPNPNIILINDKTILEKAFFNKLSDNYLIISNNNNNNNKFNNFKNILFKKGPTPLNYIKNYVYKTMSKKISEFGDIRILENKKLICTKTNLSCFLTDIENEILSSLVDVKKITRSNIKKNILKVRADLETNSLDSHLSRIRKKFEKIQSSINITSKNDFLLLVFNSKDLD